jgi:hypothetical protein
MQNIIPVPKHHPMNTCMTTEGIAIRAINLGNIRIYNIRCRFRPFYMKERSHATHFVYIICGPEPPKRR